MSAIPNIEIIVETQFVEHQSDAKRMRYTFTYTINITNHGSEPVTLLNRYWHICDNNNRIQEIHGEGVIGQQPEIQAGQSFQYTSGAIIETPAGIMHGYYEFITGDNELFKADIPMFSLVDPSNLH